MDSLLSRFEPYLKSGNTILVYVVGEPSSPPPFWAMVLLQTSLQTRVKERLGLPMQRLLVRPLLWRWTSSSGPSLSTTVGQSSSLFGPGRQSFNISGQARSIYDSLQVTVMPRVNEEPFLPQLPNDQGMPVRFPHLTLAPSAHLTRSRSTSTGRAAFEQRFDLRWPTTYVDVVHRSVLLHVGYCLAATEEELTIVTVMDELAQGYDIKAWPGGRGAQKDIDDIWSFACHFARKAKIGWKVVICRGAGGLQFEELEMWSRLLSKSSSFVGLEHIVDVSLALADDQSNLAIVAPKSMARRTQTEIPTSQEGKAKHSIDTSRVSYALHPATRTSVTISDGEDVDSQILALRSSLTVTLFQQTNMSTSIAQPSCLFHSALCPHQLWIHLLQVYPNPLSRLEKGTNDDLEHSLDERIRRMTNSFHDLEGVARYRHQILEVGQHLPWHLAMLTLLLHGSQLFRR